MFFYIENAQVTAAERDIIDQIQHKGVITSPQDKMAQPETQNLRILGMFNLIYTNFVHIAFLHIPTFAIILTSFSTLDT